jgi:YD repeat-containing protein
VPDAAVTADRLVEVLSKPLSWASTYTLAGAAGGRLRAAYVQDQVCAGEIGVTVGAGTAWLAAGGACDRHASELVPALREASAACEARWAEVPADRRCLAVRPFLGPGATAADLLRVLGDLHGAGEAVRFAYDPLGRTFRQCDPSAPAPKPEEYCR